MPMCVGTVQLRTIVSNSAWSISMSIILFPSIGSQAFLDVVLAMVRQHFLNSSLSSYFLSLSLFRDIDVKSSNYEIKTSPKKLTTI
jgi:hypothetical protein